MHSSNTRLGLILFAIYLAFYGGFVFLSAFAPASMESKPFAGLNLAVIYGFGLIVLALLLAIVYEVFADSGSDSSANGEDAS